MKPGLGVPSPESHREEKSPNIYGCANCIALHQEASFTFIVICMVTNFQQMAVKCLGKGHLI
jgi:hypothetical protein